MVIHLALPGAAHGFADLRQCNHIVCRPHSSHRQTTSTYLKQVSGCLGTCRLCSASSRPLLHVWREQGWQNIPAKESWRVSTHHRHILTCKLVNHSSSQRKAALTGTALRTLASYAVYQTWNSLMFPLYLLVMLQACLK